MKIYSKFFKIQAQIVSTYFLIPDVYQDELLLAPNNKEVQYLMPDTKHSIFCEPGRYKFIFSNLNIIGGPFEVSIHRASM